MTHEIKWTRVEPHYREYADPLRRYVRHVAADRGLSESLVDTDGVVHEAFISMLGHYDSINAPRAWLFTVARNMVSKIAERHRRRWAGGDPQGLLDAGTARWSSLPAQASPEVIYEARRVVETIAELPDRQKKAVYLHRIEGWTAKEIAGLLGIKSESTVGVHIHRGTSRLRQMARQPNLIAGLVSIAGTVAALISVLTTSVQPSPAPPPGWIPPPHASAGLGRFFQDPSPDSPRNVVIILLIAFVLFLVGAVVDVTVRAVRKRRCSNSAHRLTNESTTDTEPPGEGDTRADFRDSGNTHV